MWYTYKMKYFSIIKETKCYYMLLYEWTLNTLYAKEVRHKRLHILCMLLLLFKIYLPMSQGKEILIPSMCVFVCAKSLSHVEETPGTEARPTLLSIEFSRQEYWSGLPFSTPGDLPDPGIEHMSLASRALAGRFFTNFKYRSQIRVIFIHVHFLPPSLIFWNIHYMC